MSELQTDPLIGAQFGTCVIDSKIAVGGFGTIYRARDTNLGILRALKVFHPHLSGQEEFRKRFNVEMQVLANGEWGTASVQREADRLVLDATLGPLEECWLKIYRLTGGGAM